MEQQMTPEEFRTYLLEEQGMELELSQIRLLYSAYFAESHGVVEDTIPFISIMNYLVESGQITDAAAIESIGTLNQIYSLDYDAFVAEMERPMTTDDFCQYMKDEQGIEISKVEALLLYYGYFQSIGKTYQGAIPFLPLMNYLLEANFITDPAAIANVEMINELYALDYDAFMAQMNEQMTSDEFRNYLMTEQGMNLSEAQTDILYSAYFATKNDVIGDRIPFLSVMQYIVKTNQVTDPAAIETVEMLTELYAMDLEGIKAQINTQMSAAEFGAYMKNEYGITIGAEQMSILYAAYSASVSDAVMDKIAFLPLMNYLIEMGQVTDKAAIDTIKNANEIYAMDLEGIKAQINTQMSAAEFGAYMKDEYGITIGAEQMSILYAAYSASVSDAVMDKIAFLPLMNYLIEMGQVTDKAAIDTIKNANEIYAMDLEGIKAQINTQMSADEFRAYMKDEQGVEIGDDQAKILYAAYSASELGAVQERITFLPLMNYLLEMGQITDPDAVAKVNDLNELYGKVPNAYDYEEFLPMVEQMVTTLTGEPMPVVMDALAIQQLYIMYYYDNNMIPENTIVGRDFVDFIIDTAKTNTVVSSQLPADISAKLDDVCTVDEFLSDETAYDFRAMADRVGELQGSVKSISSSEKLDESAVSGVYIKYAIGEKLGLDEPIMACDLLGFVVDNMDSNRILSSKMSDAAREKLAGAQEAMRGAEGLLIAENYSRMLLSVDLPSESKESSDFVRFLSAAVKETLGEDAHIAGEMVSTYDLQESFDHDNKLISIFTIVSIFIIVMIIFRSLSLPVILVAVIQGAIWISMSTSLITGPMFFMSYIMATCILMGSTIDYGILMSTNYVQYRNTMDRKEALYRSVKSAMPTVFTSGLILTICGFVVGFIASQNSISTVGVLLGKGTLVSVAMITVVLPSILYLLDGFILKLSVKSKKSKK